MIMEKVLADLTKTYGGEYGLNHTLRILRLVDLVGVGTAYDRDVVRTAAYLHDWGGYPAWAKEGVDHALRSVEVARHYLENGGMRGAQIDGILECIGHHHDGDPGKSLEAQLLSDADGLDFIGTIGILRDFSTKPRELRKAFETSRARVEKISRNILLESSKRILEERIRRMERIFSDFIEETFGLF